MRAFLFCSKLCASSFCSIMRFKMDMNQMHFGSSQNKNGDQNGQMANPNEPLSMGTNKSGNGLI